MTETHSSFLPVLICSVPLEAEALLAAAADVQRLTIPRLEAYSARVCGVDIYLTIGGMGKTNAARALTALVENRPVSGVIGFGVGGAYLEQNLGLADLVLASSESYGDEGVEAPQGWISCEGIGIPLMQKGDVRHFNTFPVDQQWLQSARDAFSARGRSVAVGPFVTVSSCSGTEARGRALSGRFEALCETMEGAAYAHVAAIYELPYIELRGISNMVEDRNMAAWQLKAAADAAGEGVRVVLAALAGRKS